MAITFGRCKHPDQVDMQWIANNKTEGVGWDNLGKRNPKFIALHRMWGTLKGTDSFFAPKNSPHLTDYAIGCLDTDGAALAGEIHKYNDPLGYRSGWASGRVSAPYGDGKAIIDKYGINAVNRDGVSIEMSGFDNTPIDEKTWKEYVALCAYWCDFMKIPYTSMPINPATGISAFVWHQEFTIGTGKKCPFTYVMNNTNRLIKDTTALMKKHQEGAGTVPPVVIPGDDVPTPQYATPSPIAALVPFADDDPDAIDAVVKDTNNEALTFTFVGDVVEVIRNTSQYQYADKSSNVLGPNYPVGTQLYVPWMLENEGHRWYVTDQWRRLLVDDTERVSDVQEAA